MCEGGVRYILLIYAYNHIERDCINTHIYMFGFNWLFYFWQYVRCYMYKSNHCKPHR